VREVTLQDFVGLRVVFGPGLNLDTKLEHAKSG